PVDSVSEDRALKKQVFRELDRLAGSDAILATNSSSYPSSRLLNAVESLEQLPGRPLPDAADLMSCCRPDAAVIDALVERLPRDGLGPFTVMRESAGFLFNRIWLATRRECPMVIAEGVSTPRSRPHLATLARHGAGTVPAHGSDRPRRRARRRGAPRYHPR